MTSPDTAASSNARHTRNSRGSSRPVKRNLRIDMTPMVDLGFLLIAFFVMTAELNKPAVVSLNMPKDGPPMLLGDTSAMTILLDGSRVFYYEGDWAKALQDHRVFAVSLDTRTGIGAVIRRKQASMGNPVPGGNQGHRKDGPGNTGLGKDGLMLLVKASRAASYRQVVQAMDQALIHGLNRYALVSLDEQEREFLTAPSLQK